MVSYKQETCFIVAQHFQKQQNCQKMKRIELCTTDKPKWLVFRPRHSSINVLWESGSNWDEIHDNNMFVEIE